MMLDPYKVLGVSPGATDDEIKAAYRALAKKYHPDLNGGSASAEAKMKEINEAYTELMKAKKNGGTYAGPNASQQGTYRQNPFNQGYGSYGYGQQGQSRGDDYGGRQGNDFDFGSFFNMFGGGYGQGQEQRRAYAGSYDFRFSSARQAIIDGRFRDAVVELENMAEKSAEWYYWHSCANAGMGNRVASLNDARMAVNLDPNNADYREWLQSMQSGSEEYRQNGRRYGFRDTLCGNPCLTCCIANTLCNCCLGGRCFFC